MNNINENYLELVDIEDISYTDTYVNMIDIGIKEDNSFMLANGIISHNSAAGSVKQARDSETEGVYALKGKVKNTRKLSDLTSNTELLEIMSILDIEPEDEKQPVFDKIIIAADEDCIFENHNILTKSGLKKIKNVDYNDLVLTHNGTYEHIEKIIETKKTEYIEIEINGEVLIYSLYHKLIIVRHGKVIEIFAKDVEKTDFFLQKRT